MHIFNHFAKKNHTENTKNTTHKIQNTKIQNTKLPRTPIHHPEQLFLWSQTSKMHIFNRFAKKIIKKIQNTQHTKYKTQKYKTQNISRAPIHHPEQHSL
jgi:hypothetical protein